ncbi:hypothetical protein IAR55_002682 [Kwoniella newhampshirensis]|uniref:IgA peptidase M64-domain-containing protein n=1 Tax=Kwoniella newhampshirensis TaxID=1651941 RepID=A0AAW0YXJ0_9TREE
MRVLLLSFSLLFLSPSVFTSPTQRPFAPPLGTEVESEYHLNTGLDADDAFDEAVPPPAGMVLYPLHSSGPRDDRVNLMFLADGYTPDEQAKFVDDATKLKDDIVSSEGAMYSVSHLLNVWAAFLPSNISGIGTHDTPLPGAAFGLYRPGSELRGVYLDQPKKARAACRFFREDSLEGGCDQPILLGNDPLYGGLGGEFTIITASELNGPLVLRHELGHSLIPVGEEYEGGFAYFGVSSDKIDHLHDLKWKRFLTNPKEVRVEDAQVPLQVYPWHDLDDSSYTVAFTSNNTASRDYPTALLRASISSIPYASHIFISLNNATLDLSDGFPKAWKGTNDRRWLEVSLGEGLLEGKNVVTVGLTEDGKREKAGQGGKMIDSIEIIEYGGNGRFNHTEGFIGAFPTYAMDGSVTLRPTNEECLMRKVNYPSFCPVCAHGLKTSLETRIAKKGSGSSGEQREKEQ